jgi:hypothetical protein
MVTMPEKSELPEKHSAGVDEGLTIDEAHDSTHG